MSLSDWLLEKKIERQTRDPEVKLKRTRISYFLWCIAIFLWGFIFTDDVFSGASEFSDYVMLGLFLCMIPLFIMSFKHSFIRGIAKTWYLPILYAGGLYICSVAGMFAYTVVNFLGYYIAPAAMLDFFVYWFVAGAAGSILGAVCSLFKRK